MTRNPFVYGEAVLGENFANRQTELRELVRDLMDGERIFLILPRTRFLLKTLRSICQSGMGYPCINVEFFKRLLIMAAKSSFPRILSKPMTWETSLPSGRPYES